MAFGEPLPATGYTGITLPVLSDGLSASPKAIASLTADLTDEHKAETGLRQEGGSDAVLQFTTKLGGAVGPLYGGFTLDLVVLEEGIRPGSVEQSALDALALIGADAIVPMMLVAFFITFRFSMTEERLGQIQALIARRRQDQ